MNEATVTRIESTEELQLLDYKDSDLYNPEEKILLGELFDEMFGGLEEQEVLRSDSPEIIFSKYLWVIKKMESEIDKIKSASLKLIEEIESWEQKKINQKLSQIEFLSGNMEKYLKVRDLKSMSLPNGSIGLRKLQPKIEITDEVMFYESADPVLLKHKPESYEPDLRKIKEYIKSTGVLPVGVEMTNQNQKFYYKFAGKEF